MSNCPICHYGQVTDPLSDPLNTLLRYNCDKCGTYLITDIALERIQSDKKHTFTPKIAAYIRSRNLSNKEPIAIFLDMNKKSYAGPSITINDIIKQYPSSISDRIDHVVINLSKLSKFTGQFFQIDRNDYPLFYADSIEIDSMIFMIDLLEKADFIDFENTMRDAASIIKIEHGAEMRLSARGWERLYQLETSTRLSNNAFIAMSFNTDMEEVYRDAIEKAVSDSGFNPIRVDKEQHNEKICDKIILEIRRSRFLVCDFTDHKHGVYFESGFALGLNIPVIWMCRKDNLDDAHFDTRQYNHIVWETKVELYEKLKDRILATIV